MGNDLNSLVLLFCGMLIIFQLITVILIFSAIKSVSKQIIYYYFQEMRRIYDSQEKEYTKAKIELKGKKGEAPETY